MIINTDEYIRCLNLAIREMANDLKSINERLIKLEEKFKNES